VSVRAGKRTCLRCSSKPKQERYEWQYEILNCVDYVVWDGRM
jgi:hypothetical protein